MSKQFKDGEPATIAIITLAKSICKDHYKVDYDGVYADRHNDKEPYDQYKELIESFSKSKLVTGAVDRFCFDLLDWFSEEEMRHTHKAHHHGQHNKDFCDINVESFEQQWVVDGIKKLIAKFNELHTALHNS